MKLPPVAVRSSAKPQAARFGLHSPESTDSRREQRLSEIRGLPERAPREIDAEADRAMAAIVARTHAGYERRTRDEQVREFMAELDRGRAEAWAIARTVRDPRASLELLTHLLEVFDERERTGGCLGPAEIDEPQYPFAARVAPSCPAGAYYNYQSGNEENDRKSQPDMALDRRPVEPEARKRWDEVAARYKVHNRHRCPGCGSTTVARRGRGIVEFCHVVCDSWACVECGPAKATRWHFHLLAKLQAQPVWRFQLPTKRAWEAYSRRARRQSVPVNHSRISRSDGTFDVFTTMRVPGVDPVPADEIESALGEALAAVPRDKSKTRRVTTSAGWQLEPAEPKPVVTESAPVKPHADAMEVIGMRAGWGLTQTCALLDSMLLPYRLAGTVKRPTVQIDDTPAADAVLAVMFRENVPRKWEGLARGAA